MPVPPPMATILGPWRRDCRCSTALTISRFLSGAEPGSSALTIELLRKNTDVIAAPRPNASSSTPRIQSGRKVNASQ